MTRAMASCCLVVTMVIAGAAVSAQQPAQGKLREPDVIFVPTPPAVVAAMLKVAGVGPGDVVYDLGSGDGRIPIAAVKDFGAARATGIDINPERIREANASLQAAGVGDRVRFLKPISSRQTSATRPSSPCICCPVSI